MEEALLIQAVVNWATHNERLSWNRKRKNIEKVLIQLRVLEDKILEIKGKAQPLYDEISLIRGEMVITCIHPEDQLVAKRDEQAQELYIECKFCNRKLMPTNASEDTKATL